MATTSSTSSSSSIFSGSSRYAADFSTLIDRAVSIASLPISQLNNQKTSLTDQATALTDLDTQFQALATAVQGLEDSLGSSSYETIVSDTSTLSATVSDGALEGTYSVEVRDIGAYASSMTSSAWDNSSNSSTFTLKVGDSTVPITTLDNKATTIAAAINSQAGGLVSATVVNIGGADNPDYRIALKSKKLGTETPQLLKDGTDIQSEQTAGRKAVYVVNASGVEVQSDSRSVSIAQGLTVNLLAANSGHPVDVTLTRSSTPVANALSAFATAYNATLDKLTAQRGTAGGVLVGQSIINTLSNALSSVATFSSSNGSITTLGDIGLNLGSDGRLTFNTLSFSAADLQYSSSVNAFLGSSSTDGFLKLATSTLSNITDSFSGTLKEAEDDITNQQTALTARISDEQTRIDSLKEQLQAQMAAADALIASMEQQYTYYSNLFSTMSSNSSK